MQTRVDITWNILITDHPTSTQQLCAFQPVVNSPQVDTKIFDGPALDHLLHPKGCKTFND